MADLSDVENALVNLIAQTIYPNGMLSTSAILDGPGAPVNCRVYPGWPDPTKLDNDLASKILNISVFAQPGMERNVSRYPRDWHDQYVNTPTITGTATGQTVTLAGTVTTGNYVTIIAGSKTASYAAIAGDTLSSIASALAALLNSQTAAFATGATITVMNPVSSLIVRTAAPGTVIRELKRQQRRFTTTVFAPNNQLRKAASMIIEPVLAATDFLTMPDNSLARLIYENANDGDRAEKQGVLIRDIFWWVEYATTQVMAAYPITGFTQTINNAITQTS